MQAKKDLAARIVRDFYSADAATKATEDWAKQFQKHQAPDVLDVISVPFTKVATGTGDPIAPRSAPPDVQVLAQDVGLQLAAVIRVDKLLAESGLADSASDGGRKLKQGAVEIDAEPIVKPKLAVYSHVVLLTTDPSISAPTLSDLTSRTRTTYQGPLEVGEDLMTIVISDRVDVRRFTQPERQH